MAYEKQYYKAQIDITEMNASGDYKFDLKLDIYNDNENATELQTFEIIVETLLSEVTVQFWVLV